mmetsp:Transcript_142640/g.443657  ORF Transcript_142640/g.443657 Transcript_142640/m.443657 type:complete len:83 (-) Transcript_142640:1020-1268(-)
MMKSMTTIEFCEKSMKNAGRLVDCASCRCLHCKRSDHFQCWWRERKGTPNNSAGLLCNVVADTHIAYGGPVTAATTMTGKEY